MRGRNIVAISVGLFVLGGYAIYGASALRAYLNFASSEHYLIKHLGAGMCGFALLQGVRRLPEDVVERLVLPLYLAGVLLLLLVQVPALGYRAGGAWRWLRLGPIRFQPAELVKIALILLVARNTARFPRPSHSASQSVQALGQAGVLALPYFVLLLLQPDFGTTAHLGVLVFLLLFVAGVQLRCLAVCAGMGLGAAALLVMHQPYRLQRFLAFLDPWEHFHYGGFQLVQSWLSFYNGGLGGLGLGESKQKLFYLPEVHTDFIVSLLAEELGLIGTSLALFLFFVFAQEVLRAAADATRMYERLVVIGLGGSLVSQAILNFCVVMGIVPTKGVAMPFLSSGGSSLVCSCLTVGVMLHFIERAELAGKAI